MTKSEKLLLEQLQQSLLAYKEEILNERRRVLQQAVELAEWQRKHPDVAAERSLRVKQETQWEWERERWAAIVSQLEEDKLALQSRIQELEDMVGHADDNGNCRPLSCPECQ